MKGLSCRIRWSKELALSNHQLNHEDNEMEEKMKNIDMRKTCYNLYLSNEDNGAPGTFPFVTDNPAQPSLDRHTSFMT